MNNNTTVKKKNNNQNNNNGNTKTNNNNNNKLNKLDINNCVLDFEKNDEREKMKAEILKTLTDINENLEASSSTKNAINLTLVLFGLIVEDQQKIRNRQKIISKCLKKYDEILQNYGDKNITIKKLNEIAQIIKSNNVNIKKLL